MQVFTEWPVVALSGGDDDAGAPVAESSDGGRGTEGGGGGSGSTGGEIADTINETVNGVDETAPGGTLSEIGVTEVTEAVVDGVAGPDSPVGEVVDDTAEAVGGLLDGNR